MKKNYLVKVIDNENTEHYFNVYCSRQATALKEAEAMFKNLYMYTKEVVKVEIA